MMRRLYSILAIIFILFALVQYNDPDPLRWMLLYGGVALAFFAGLMRWEATRYFSGAATALGLYYFLPLLPDCWRWIQSGMPSIVTTMKAEMPWVELVREALGALLSIAASSWLWWKTNRY
jgi:Transmembrane family 220, helix